MKFSTLKIVQLLFTGLFLLAAVAASSALEPALNVRAAEPTPTAMMEPRIVGGQLASPGEWPWQVALVWSGAGSTFWNDQFCGGSLINPRWVLTAAHCVTDYNGNQESPSAIDVVAGIYNTWSPQSGYQRMDVQQIIRHPSYNNTTLNNDIALIQLSAPVTLGGSGATATALIPLAASNIGSLTNVTAWVTGWGRISPIEINSWEEWPDELREVSVPIISNSECSQIWGGINGGHLCAGVGDGKDACSGDSGGPLVIYQSGQWIQAGIVSAGGEHCGIRPGIYTRVSSYRSWLDTYISHPSVTGIVRSSSSPTNQAFVTYSVTFSVNVTGVDASDFSLVTSGLTGAAINNVSGSGSSYTVTIATGSGDGTLRLDLVDNDSILNGNSIPLGGIDPNNGNFTGEIYTVDHIGPHPVSIDMLNGSPASQVTVGYLITFDEAVTGVGPEDFDLTVNNVSGAAIIDVSGSGSTRIIKINTGRGSGDLQLNFYDDGVTDLAGNPAVGDLSGGVYAVSKPALKAPALKQPASGAATNDTTPLFQWLNVSGGLSYEIQLSADADFNSLTDMAVVNALTYAPAAGYADGLYYWRVRANDVSNQPGNWSLVRSVTIDTLGPNPPALLSPADASSQPRRGLTFRWSPVSGASQYELRYDNDADCASPIYSRVLRGASLRVNVPAGGYYWCVRSRDSLGNWGAWSAASAFTIP